MLRRVGGSDAGLNYSYKCSGKDGTTIVESEILETDRGVEIGNNKRFVPLKVRDDGSASEVDSEGSAQIDLTLKPPKTDAGGYSFTQGQYVGYVRLILEVGS